MYIYQNIFNSALMLARIELEPPHPHPAGPADYKAHFTDFLKKFQSSTQTKSSTPSASKHSSDKPVYEEFWEAPARLWNPRVRSLSEEEMEAVVVSTALRCGGRYADNLCRLAVLHIGSLEYFGPKSEGTIVDSFALHLFNHNSVLIHQVHLK